MQKHPSFLYNLLQSCQTSNMFELVFSVLVWTCFFPLIFRPSILPLLFGCLTLTCESFTDDLIKNQLEA